MQSHMAEIVNVAIQSHCERYFRSKIRGVPDDITHQKSSLELRVEGHLVTDGNELENYT